LFVCAQAGPPPMSQSLSRQRTISSSSSTHSQHTVGSRRRGSSPVSTAGSQASNKTTPRSIRTASLTGGRADVQTISACRADSVFQFGLPMPASSAHTVTALYFLTNTNQLNSFAFSILVLNTTYRKYFLK